MPRLSEEQRALAAGFCPRVRILYQVLRRRFPSADEAECIGAAHEAVVDAVLRYEQDRVEGTPFAAFVYLRAWGAMYDVLRGQGRNPWRPIDEAPDEGSDMADGPEGVAAAAMVLRQLHNVPLTHDEAGLVHALYIRGRSLAEHGQEAGVPKTTVFRWHQRIIGELRRRCTSCGEAAKPKSASICIRQGHRGDATKNKVERPPHFLRITK